MDKLCHFEDCYIERKDEDHDILIGACAELRNEEGELIFRFPSAWTDEQIKTALKFANDAYAKGIGVGMQRKATEIKACIGL
jgi:hypothetical protein